MQLPEILVVDTPPDLDLQAHWSMIGVATNEMGGGVVGVARNWRISAVRRDFRRIRAGGEAVRGRGRSQLVDIILCQMLKQSSHIDVLLHWHSVQSHPAFLGQLVHLFPIKSGLFTFHPLLFMFFSYGVTADWCIRSILFCTKTIGIEWVPPHSSSTFRFHFFTASKEALEKIERETTLS